ncbi:hypothetical protein DFH06DRAFT_1020188, partial [Mycena polygramma]
YVGFAAFTILIWDHIDTFTAERNNLLPWTEQSCTYLFLLNRYLTPLGFMVNLFAYLSSVWTNESSCRHFIRYEGAMTLIGVHVVGIMMFLRIYALYSTRRVVVAGVFFILLVSICVNGWLLAHGQRVLIVYCLRLHALMLFWISLRSTIASSSAWLPLLYDSVVLVLTLVKALPLVRKSNGTYVMKRLLEDGLIYYAAIFSVTLVLTIMIVSAPSFSITVTMMSRITLNLKKCASKSLQSTILREPGSLVFQSVSVSPPEQAHSQSRYRDPDW